MTTSSFKANRQNLVSNPKWLWSIVTICFLPLGLEWLGMLNLPIASPLGVAAAASIVTYYYFPFAMKFSFLVGGSCLLLSFATFLSTGSEWSLLPLGVGIVIVVMTVHHFYDETVDGEII